MAAGGVNQRIGPGPWPLPFIPASQGFLPSRIPQESLKNPSRIPRIHLEFISNQSYPDGIDCNLSGSGNVRRGPVGFRTTSDSGIPEFRKQSFFFFFFYVCLFNFV